MLEGYKTKVSAVEAEAKATADAEAGISPAPALKTLSEILKDSQESALLGRFMEVDNNHELAGRMAMGDLTQTDLEKLEEYRVKNIEKLGQVKSLETTITPEYVKEFAANSPEFQKLVNLVGPEKAAVAIKNQLREVVASDPDRFDNMHSALERLSSYKSGEMKSLETKIREQCKDFKTELSDDDFAAVMAIEDPYDREVELRKKVRGSFGIFRKAGDYLSLGKWSRPAAQELAKNKAEMDMVIRGLNDHIGAMGGTLNAMVSENVDVRKAFAKELIDEKPAAKAPEEGFGSIKKETQALDQEWKTFRTASNFDTASPMDQTTIQDNFRRKVKAERVSKPPKKGVFARIWAAFFDKAVDTKELN
jgi:hypothetical protein